MKYPVYNQEGKKVGTTLLPKEIFEVKINLDLIHQVARSQMANRRQIIAHTKDRGHVRGGGRKPWRQKGTGRARHGSIRSPLWRGGGVTFGPTKKKVFKKKISRKMKRKALFMTLVVKKERNLLFILDQLEISKPKTREITQIIKSLRSKIFSKTEDPLTKGKQIKNLKKGSILIALPKINKNIILATRNIPRVETVEARNLNVLNLLSFKYLIVAKESIKVIKDTFVKI